MSLSILAANSLIKSARNISISKAFSETCWSFSQTLLQFETAENRANVYVWLMRYLHNAVSKFNLTTWKIYARTDFSIQNFHCFIGMKQYHTKVERVGCSWTFILKNQTTRRRLYIALSVCKNVFTNYLVHRMAGIWCIPIKPQYLSADSS